MFIKMLYIGFFFFLKVTSLSLLWQLNSVVKEIQQMSPSKKLPLVVLHSRRVRGGAADIPKNKKLLENWQSSGVLYATPTGSNDDW